jgi:hypothetical protein
VRSCPGAVSVTIQGQSHVNGSREKSTVVNVQGGVSSWNRRGCETIIIDKKHPRLRHFSEALKAKGLFRYELLYDYIKKKINCCK